VGKPQEGLNEPKCRPKLLNPEMAVMDLLENQDVSGMSVKWQANMERIFNEDGVQAAAERRRRKEQEEEAKRRRRIQLAEQKRLAKQVRVMTFIILLHLHNAIDADTRGCGPNRKRRR
jgi:hypothetical protein